MYTESCHPPLSASGRAREPVAADALTAGAAAGLARRRSSWGEARGVPGTAVSTSSRRRSPGSRASALLLPGPAPPRCTFPPRPLLPSTLEDALPYAEQQRPPFSEMRAPEPLLPEPRSRCSRPVGRCARSSPPGPKESSPPSAADAAAGERRGAGARTRQTCLPPGSVERFEVC